MAHNLLLVVTCDQCGWQITKTTEQTCSCAGHEKVPPFPFDWTYIPGDCTQGPLAQNLDNPPAVALVLPALHPRSRVIGMATGRMRGASVLRQTHTMGHKYHAQPTDGFASKGEAQRARELGLEQQAGVIVDLEFQPTVTLLPGITYRLDFVYVETATGQKIYEDWKGVRVPTWKLKAKLWRLVGPGRLRITSRHGVEDIDSERRTLSEPGMSDVTPRLVTPDDVAMIRALAHWSVTCRDLLGLSQSQVGAQAGHSQGAISRVESGKCFATPLVTFRAVARCYAAHGFAGSIPLPAPGALLGDVGVFAAPDLDPLRVALLQAFDACQPSRRAALVDVVRLIVGLVQPVPAVWAGSIEQAPQDAGVP